MKFIHFFIHASFDILAWLVVGITLYVLRRTWFQNNHVASHLRFGYLTAVLLGAGLGAWALGSLNSWMSGQEGLARSIAGALAGAIVSIELYKKLNGIKVRTGSIYALPLALGITVGRIGCLLSGLEDFTHGIPTQQSWGWNFGDDILRHPVQLYESISMTSFSVVYIIMVRRGSTNWHKNGFYIAVGFYAMQRFVLEYLKPYHEILFGLTVFQLVSVVLASYAAIMICTGSDGLLGQCKKYW